MTLTLLVDLDDTLLGNDINKFLPAYLQALGNHLAQYAPQEILIPTLLSATRSMVLNNRPDRRLKEVFDAAFFPALGLKQEDLQEPIDAFYREVFPGLQNLCQRIPEAARLVDQALARGYRVAIATNPLFPRPAILHSLAWAGIPVDNYDLPLISSYERFHFAKPNLAYFAELLGQMGWPDGPVVMVGDDLHNDIEPARRLGIPAFWISKNGKAPPDATHGPNAGGTLLDLIPWIESLPASDLTPVYNQPEAWSAILRATPASLDSLSEGLPSVAWTEPPRPGEWNLNEIFCHLRDVDAEVNLPRIRKVLQEHNPFLPGMDTDPWATERQYICQNGPEVLESFTALRIELVELLDSLGLEDWERPARHAIFGPTHLKELVSISSGHDRLHLRQAYESLQTVIGYASA
ncbi:MAG TPA: DinB family protein [Anaerolineales bacterium]|nr:DinB family protein [Anaerolineales bacterium]